MTTIPTDGGTEPAVTKPKHNNFCLALSYLKCTLMRVPVKPKKPQLEYGGAILGATITLKERQEVLISCVSRYGNPPAVIKW